MADKKVDKKTDKKGSGKPNAFKRLIKYFRECKGEIKKITWPTFSQTTKNFGVVLVVMIVMGLFIFALDQGLFALLGLVMNTAGN